MPLSIAWLSSRVLGSDLCSTTQINLANGLASRGHSVVFYSPGTVSNCLFEHVQIIRSSVKGFQSQSVANKIRARLDEISNYDVIMLDWTIAKLAKNLNQKVILVDRGPPADKGIFAKLQWLVWSKAWKKTTQGLVVSEKHRDFVIKKIKRNNHSIGVVPAGVDVNLFKSDSKEGPLKLAYHGRVDVHRGVMSLPMILAGLHSQGVEATLHIYGTGDAVERLKSMELEGLEVTDALPQDDLAKLLSKYDVGLLPMPGKKVWSLASPLKRSEYLACGMVVCGIDHAGHRIDNSGDWLQLFSQKEFIANTVSWIKSLDRDRLSALQQESRTYAEENLSWAHSVDALETIILS